MDTNTPHFDDSSFWDKLKNFAKTAGKEVIEKALCLYYAAQQPQVPLWAKTVIYSALAYFVLPTDAVPDPIPMVGFTDDLGALAAALATCAVYINDEVKALAKGKLRDWFGE